MLPILQQNASGTRRFDIMLANPLAACAQAHRFNVLAAHENVLKVYHAWVNTRRFFVRHASFSINALDKLDNKMTSHRFISLFKISWPWPW